MAVLPKGATLEELVRAYFARQGYFVLRSVSVRFEEEEVTDVDVWLFGRQGAGARTRALVDVKDKRSPKAFERILWTRGMQLALGCDRAIVATTDNSVKVARFAQQQKVTLLPAEFLKRVKLLDEPGGRLSLEEFTKNIQRYPNYKQDGDWLKRIADAKSAVVSLQPYPAFNKAISSFRFFAERAATRAQHREQALRGAFLSAALACVALDSAIERLFFEDGHTRYQTLLNGITYGDAGDGRVQNTIDSVLSVIAKGLNNGRVIASRTREALNELLGNVRADIIAEFFSKEQSASLLYNVSRELDARAHMHERTDLMMLTVDAKSVLGIFADFVQVKRPALLSSDFVAEHSPIKSSVVSHDAAVSSGKPSLSDAEPREGDDPNGPPSDTELI